MIFISRDHVQTALQLPSFDVRQAQLKMAPIPRAVRRPQSKNGSPRLAAVLVLLFPTEQHGLSTVLIQRNQYPGVHSGQIGLPGGQREENDGSFAVTALRETHEEIGVPYTEIELIGNLTSLYIPPSDFEVYPYVGYSAHHPVWKPDPSEVAGVIETPLATLFDDTVKHVDEIEVRGITVRAPYYAIEGHRVWGATAIILSELESRLRLTLDR